MSDRDWRSGRDARADRYGSGDNDRPRHDRSGEADGSAGGSGGGRYNRAHYRKDTDGGSYDDRRGGHRRRSTSRERDDYRSGGGDRRSSYQRPRRDDSSFGGGEGVNTYNTQWQQQQQQQQFMTGGGPGGPMFPNMPQDMNGGYPQFAGGMMPQNSFYPIGGSDVGGGNAMSFGGPGFNDPMMQQNAMFNPNGGGGGDGSGMDSTQLLQFLLQQQQQQPSMSDLFPPQQQQQQQFADGHRGRRRNHGGGGENSGDAPMNNFAPAASRALPSVEDFVPVVPKSLLSLVRGPGGDAAGNDVATPPPPNGAEGGGAMVLLEAPKISPEADRRAREQRRAHITGFPNGTSREELEDYFRVLLPEVRRLQTEREIRQLAEESGLLRDEGEDAVRHVPPNANLSNIDDLKDITVNIGKVKGFSFIELRLGDMIDELVQQCEADPQRFLFNAAIDGRTYPLAIRRPRDAVPLTGVEEHKVVLIGFPLSMPAETIKPVFESFGDLLAFELKNGYAYGEFEKPRDALDFRAEMHGVVLGNSMVIALPLYDWLKALLVREGMDIAIADDDPMSGNYVMKQIRERMPDVLGGVAGGEGGAGGDGGANSMALVIAEDPEAASLQIMRELLDMSFTLPDMLARFAALYPHLRPLYGNTQVTVFPTTVLVLLNLFDEEELVYDTTYSLLLADIEEEVEKYGRVRQLLVPRREARPKLPEAPKPGVDYAEDDAAAREAAMAAYSEAKRNFGAVLGRYMNRQTHPVWGGYGRVFVEYETIDEAAAAQQQIAGKLFGERTVVTSFLYPDLLKEGGEEEEEEEEPNDDTAKPSEAAADPADANGEQAEADAEDGAAPQDGEEDAEAETAASEHAEDID